MDPETFREYLAKDTAPRNVHPLLQALWHDAKGEWQRAHELAQSQPGYEAAAVHAYLHRKEGDLSNADYWYDRAGRKRQDIPLSVEWENLVRQLLRHEAVHP
ncbi:MAG TPA: hypothetical protein VLN59_05040 [Burkholderiales bacterium]|nr:hypothetical protein [Burkholderiales bacterium]